MQYETALGGMKPEQFLREYWQKKPLLIRQAFPGFKTLLEPNELAGLACEEEVDARLVIEKGGSRPWELRRGPFTAKAFQSLPASHWTLLVQEVDHFMPEVARLREKFRFIPDWRIDDIMVSYSTDQGSVGPHVDNYDVFLLQGMGTRTWHICHKIVDEEALLEGVDLRVLKSFEADASWTLEPGDMLYLPPRIAHHGISEGEGMTYSVGFRSPSHADLLASFTDNLLAQWEEKERFTDPDLKPQEHPAEITQASLTKVVAWLRSLPVNEEEVRHWFGRLVTGTKHEGSGLAGGEGTLASDRATLSQLKQWLEKGKKFKRSEDARLAFMKHPDSVLLFINGQEYLLPLAAEEFVKVLSRDYELDASHLLPFYSNYGTLLLELIANGVFYCEDL